MENNLKAFKIILAEGSIQKGLLIHLQLNVKLLASKV